MERKNSEVEQARQALEEGDAARAHVQVQPEFPANMSHELRTRSTAC